MLDKKLGRCPVQFGLRTYVPEGYFVKFHTIGKRNGLVVQMGTYCFQIHRLDELIVVFLNGP